MIFLVANKKDKEQDREVSTSKGEQFAREKGLHGFFETSAKTSENVDDTFTHVTRIIFTNIQRGNVYDLANESVGIKPGNVAAVGHS